MILNDLHSMRGCIQETTPVCWFEHLGKKSVLFLNMKTWKP